MRLMFLFHVKVKDSVPIQKSLLSIGHNGVQHTAKGSHRLSQITLALNAEIVVQTSEGCSLSDLIRLGLQVSLHSKCWTAP